MRNLIRIGDTVLTPEQALELVLQHASKSIPRKTGVDESLGLILAEDILSPGDFPPFDRAMMDGFAVRLSGGSSRLPVLGRIQAGDNPAGPLLPDTSIEIMTGAPCPPETTAVIPYEDLRPDQSFIDVPPGVSPGQFIAPKGSECRKDQEILSKGTRITPLVIAVLSSFGLTEVTVYPSPALTVIVTGKEILLPGESTRPGQIHDANGPMIKSMAREMGIKDITIIHVDDTLETLMKALSTTRDSQIVIISGGVSEGVFDLVPKALVQWGATTIFHKVSQKPGKPLLFAKKEHRLCFGLPGNPLAVHLCFHRYVASAIRIMQGKFPEPMMDEGAATGAQNESDRTRFQLARASRKDPSSPLELTIYEGRRSSDLFSVFLANGVVSIPPASPQQTKRETSNDSSNQSPNARWIFEWLGNKG